MLVKYKLKKTMQNLKRAIALKTMLVKYKFGKGAIQNGGYSCFKNNAC